MLRIILVSLLWAVCATCLVRPWFWKGVKKKYLFNDNGKRIGFDNDSWKTDLTIEIVCFGLTFAVSMMLYAGACVRQNLYGSLPLIIICAIAQSLWSYQPKKNRIICLTIIVLSLVLWIQDGIAGIIKAPINKVENVPITTVTMSLDGENTDKVTSSKTEKDTVVKTFVSANEIKNLFKVNSATGPTYNNGKYIFAVSGGDTGMGVVIIDKNYYTEAKFISCSEEFDIRGIRSKYPTKKLKELYITVSDDDVPYGIFAMAKKSWLLGTYEVDGYVMFNLITGETEEYTQEQLPSFVTNN